MRRIALRSSHAPYMRTISMSLHVAVVLLVMSILPFLAAAIRPFFRKILLPRAFVSKRNNFERKRRRRVQELMPLSSFQLTGWVSVARDRAQGPARNQRETTRVARQGGVAQVKPNSRVVGADLVSYSPICSTGTWRAGLLPKVHRPNSRAIKVAKSTCSVLRAPPHTYTPSLHASSSPYFSVSDRLFFSETAERMVLSFTCHRCFNATLRWPIEPCRGE